MSSVSEGSSVGGSRHSSITDPQDALKGRTKSTTTTTALPPTAASQYFPPSTADSGPFQLVRSGGELTLNGMRVAHDDHKGARREQAGLINDLEEEDRIARERADYERRLAEFKAGRCKTLTLLTGVRLVSDVDGDLTSFPQSGNMVRVDYEVRLLLEDGTPTYDAFDTTRAQVPFDFQLGVGYTIPAMEDALLVMSRGQRCRVRVPPLQGYGRAGYPPTIPPNADLLLDIELISFE